MLFKELFVAAAVRCSYGLAKQTGTDMCCLFL